MTLYDESIESIINTYNTVVKGVDSNALKSNNQKGRTYGGLIRATKGKLQEHITHSLVKIAWKELGGKESDIDINSKKIHIPIQQNYLNKLIDEKVKKRIANNLQHYTYKLSVDKHIYIKKKFVMGIECKSYTENAMIKRILVDFDLLTSIHKDLKCFLFQLESQLTGDYANIDKATIYGSRSTHTIMSYFNCRLHIITLLKGERTIDKPIHKNFKPLSKKSLIKAKNILKDNLIEFL
ncbi:hypothetical protein COTS27_01230 [Spirochaetota bacterium]|nr:hypothetical protein COTS27_01230 [Spirochaetota bacterium]